MSKKIRYLLLGVGFIVFLILAPLIVLYVRGVTYDFTSHSFVNTGILAVRTDPKNVQIFLNGQLKREGSGDIKFTAPGEYEVSLKKDGYNDWSKRLALTAGEVTWASAPYNAIFLLLHSPAGQTLANNVTDFYGQGSRLLYLTQNSLILADPNNMASQQMFALPKAVNKIWANDGNKDFILADTSSGSAQPALLLFNVDSGSFTNLTGIFPALPKMQFSGSGNLFALSKDTLYKVDSKRQTKTPIFTGVKAFYSEGPNLYFVQQKDKVFSLFVSPEPFGQQQELLAGLPSFENGDLFVTFEKQIFLLADGALYRANSTMQKAADGVSESNFNWQDSTLTLFHSGELDYYPPSGQNLNFVTRSNEPLKQLALKTNIGYAFYDQNNKLTAIELDTRDNQNQYVLYSGAALEKFILDDSGSNIILLDAGTLKSLNIR